MTGCHQEAIWPALARSQPAHSSCSNEQMSKWDEILLSAESTRGFALLTPAKTAGPTPTQEIPAGAGLLVWGLGCALGLC